LSGLDAIKRLIRSLTGHYAYLGMVPCSVQAQAADGTLDLLPDDLGIRGPGGLQGVKIRHGLPGCVVEVAVGARVLLGFEGGDPRRPYAALWEPGSVRRIKFNDGSQPMARLGDLITAGGPGTVCTLLPIPTAGVGAPPNNAIVAGVPCLISFDETSMLTFPQAALAAPLYGSISSGVDEFVA
jgi:hypothetical protein